MMGTTSEINPNRQILLEEISDEMEVNGKLVDSVENSTYTPIQISWDILSDEVCIFFPILRRENLQSYQA
jgi:hypothetical protein